MDKSINKLHQFLKGVKRLARWIIWLMYIILSSFVVGLSNTYYEECRMIDDMRNSIKKEEVIDDEDTNI